MASRVTQIALSFPSTQMSMSVLLPLARIESLSMTAPRALTSPHQFTMDLGQGNGSQAVAA